MAVIDMKKYHQYRKEKIKSALDEVKTNGNELELLILTDGIDERCKVYMKNKVKIGEELGVTVRVIVIEEEEQLKKIVKTGKPMILQLPIKKEFEELYSSLRPRSDVDAFFREVEMANGDFSVAPATSKGIVEFIQDKGIQMDSHVVVVGSRGKLCGKPLIQHLQALGYTVSGINSKTNKLTRESLLASADIVVLASGTKHSVSLSECKFAEWIFNVGTIVNAEGKLEMELNIDAEWDYPNITPKIGGCGVMTVCTLYENVANFYKEMMK
ncbi:MAG: hypothetical protein ACRCZ0_06625 [Cetobacterium sp.]